MYRYVFPEFSKLKVCRLYIKLFRYYALVMVSCSSVSLTFEKIDGNHIEVKLFYSQLVILHISHFRIEGLVT